VGTPFSSRVGGGLEEKPLPLCGKILLTFFLLPDVLAYRRVKTPCLHTEGSLCRKGHPLALVRTLRSWELKRSGLPSLRLGSTAPVFHPLMINHSFLPRLSRPSLPVHFVFFLLHVALPPHVMTVPVRKLDPVFFFARDPRDINHHDIWTLSLYDRLPILQPWSQHLRFFSK